jgi:hypothetical protein
MKLKSSTTSLLFRGSDRQYSAKHLRQPPCRVKNLIDFASGVSTKRERKTSWQLGPDFFPVLDVGVWLSYRHGFRLKQNNIIHFPLGRSNHS